MQRKHLKSNQTDAVKWRLRNHMAFLVDNLQYYLQVCSERFMEEVGREGNLENTEMGQFCVW